MVFLLSCGNYHTRICGLFFLALVYIAYLGMVGSGSAPAILKKGDLAAGASRYNLAASFGGDYANRNQIRY